MTRSNSRCLFLCDFTASGSLCIPPPHQTRHCLPAAPAQHKQNAATPFPPPQPASLSRCNHHAPPRRGERANRRSRSLTETSRRKTDATSRGRRSPAEGRRCLAAVSSPPLSSSGPNYPTSDVSLSSRHPLRLHSWPHAELTRVTRCAGVSPPAPQHSLRRDTGGSVCPSVRPPPYNSANSLCRHLPTRLQVPQLTLPHFPFQLQCLCFKGPSQFLPFLFLSYAKSASEIHISQAPTVFSRFVTHKSVSSKFATLLVPFWTTDVGNFEM